MADDALESLLTEEAKTQAIEPDQRGDDLGELSRATESMRALFLDES